MSTDAAGIEVVVSGSKSFCTSFLKSLAESKPGNVVCSSLSVQTILAMAAYGARGKTANQMRAALHLPEEDNIGLCGYRSLMEILDIQHDVVLSLVNRMFTASDITVKPSFKELTDSIFMSPVQSLNFADSSAAAKAINEWVAAETENRVKDVVSPGDFQSDDLFVLINIVYFRGQWCSPFVPFATSNQTFHVDETTTTVVPIMSKFYSFRHDDLPALDARFLELPYKAKSLSMIIILPNTITGLNKVLENLDKVNFIQSLKNLKYTNVDLKLPKFKVECNCNLNPTLAKMGLNTMFEPGLANFSGIADVPLNITRAVQTAFIDVNEYGSEAFPSSRMRAGRSGPVEFSIFIVDRPFYFTILHRPTGLSLFDGIIRDPSSI